MTAPDCAQCEDQRWLVADRPCPPESPAAACREEECDDCTEARYK